MPLTKASPNRGRALHTSSRETRQTILLFRRTQYTVHWNDTFRHIFAVFSVHICLLSPSSSCLGGYYWFKSIGLHARTTIHRFGWLIDLVVIFISDPQKQYVWLVDDRPVLNQKPNDTWIRSGGNNCRKRNDAGDENHNWKRKLHQFQQSRQERFVDSVDQSDRSARRL